MTRYRTNFRWWILSFDLGYVLILLILIVGGAADGRAAPLWTGVVLTPMFGFLVWLSLPDWRGLLVSDRELLVPRGVAGRQVIKVDDVAGIALCYVRAQRASGWYLRVWTTSGDQVSLLRYVSWRGPRRSHPAGAADTLRLWRHVAAAQGASGPLLTEARQHGQPSRWTNIAATWCPDDNETREVGTNLRSV